MSQRPARQWRSNLAAFRGVSPGDMDLEAPVIPNPGPKCTGVVYSPSTLSLSVGVPMTTLTPTASGAPPRYWFVAAPGLPPGLSINNGTGAISGTPTAARALAVYVVRAHHSDETLSVPLTITVS